ncbi:hypothetical protein AYO45_02130 [Gammaproteobacteria bacterium SCGC AG-212-F23]|nr:hypothetical protein AYO45_02130 [Gammaproteobacteria bacterium SCGC AG-212-F23]
MIKNNILNSVVANLPTLHYGDFEVTAIKEIENGKEHLIISKLPLDNTKPCLVRIHSSCMTGDIFGSLRCDCREQLHYSLNRLQEEGGILIYLNQEGRGIGIFNKIQAYALQEQGFDTVKANEQLGLPVDSREYLIAADILRQRGIMHFRLLTNNPHKVSGLSTVGEFTIAQEAMPVFLNAHNKQYLKTKKDKLNHQF